VAGQRRGRAPRPVRRSFPGALAVICPGSHGGTRPPGHSRFGSGSRKWIAEGNLGHAVAQFFPRNSRPALRACLRNRVCSQVSGRRSRRFRAAGFRGHEAAASGKARDRKASSSSSPNKGPFRADGLSAPAVPSARGGLRRTSKRSGSRDKISRPVGGKRSAAALLRAYSMSGGRAPRLVGKQVFGALLAGVEPTTARQARPSIRLAQRPGTHDGCVGIIR